MRSWGLRLVVGMAVLATGFAAGYYANPVGIPYTAGYVDGQRIAFIHPEVSEAGVAELLTEMLRSPVLVVPALARAPEEMLANVYVFTNGVRRGEGPFRFQADVFDRPPGSEGYTPLRMVHLVAWREGARARELRSVAAIRAAEAAGEVSVTRSGRVVNIPFLTWPGGRR